MDEISHSKLRKKTKSQISLPLFGAAMFLLGVLIIIAFRFATIKSDSLHYHANFALYINGQKDEFKSFTFYEEVASCKSHSHQNPKGRVHMHDNNSGLVHVHAKDVTWGHFFANLGYTLGNEVVATDNGVFVTDTNGNKLTFVLNGAEVKSVENKVISSEDKLLINYGNDDKNIIEQRSNSLQNDAGHANTVKDPSSCQGSEELTFLERLKQSIGIAGH